MITTSAPSTRDFRPSIRAADSRARPRDIAIGLIQWVSRTHAGGHLLNDLIGWQGDPHLSPFHIASYVVLIAGFVLLSKAWPVLWAAQREGRLATTGPYARVRHPQYLGFLLIMAGFLLQWPTLLTLLMFPILAVAYTRLAISEEREVRGLHATAYDEYAARTPRFIPRLRRQPATSARASGSSA